MLTSLTIQNYALIQELQIDWEGGLSIITGETGAGKSILLGALSLLVGQRADTGVLLDNSRKCIVEGAFALKGYGLEELFTRNELDFDDSSVIRREISPDGKSRAFVNDTPVNLSVLKELGERLIDIHSQHQTLYLENPTFQLRILDTFAQQSAELQKYNDILYAYKSLEIEYRKIFDDARKNSSDLDFFQHQFEQLLQAKLKEGEQEPLELELQTLTHSEEIKTALTSASSLFSGEEISIVSQLKETIQHIGKLKNVYSPAVSLHERLDAVLIEIKDIAHETEIQSDHIEHDPDRAEFVRQRLDLIFTLQQKHKVATISELIAFRDQLKQKIDNIYNADFRLEDLQKEISKIKNQLSAIAAVITANRQKEIPHIEERVQELLRQLGMPNAIFKVELTPTDEFTSTGTDKVRFLFSANKQGLLQDLAKVASGGEMARLMLSIKATIAEAVTLPTIIFDEIDTGVSGDIADKMGNVIARMAENAQIINITHLPQIASKGRNHFMVYKYEEDSRTETRIKALKSDERVIEIARMLSGEQLSEAAINNAKALLGMS